MADIVDGDDIGMRNRAGRFCLALKAGEIFFIDPCAFFRTLTATVRPMAGSRARYTIAAVPSPTISSTS
jgi:hypothetical protein